ncbi:MAG: cytochrome b/b6 domain-containing protein [Arenicellales bacterium]
MNTNSSENQRPVLAKKQPILVWDLGIRVFHWALVVLVIALWVTAESEGDWMNVHRWLGTTVLALVLTRVIWGFVGSETARFVTFLRSPRVVMAYLAGFFTRRPMPQTIGHNPAGGWSVLTLLILLLLQAGTGLFSNDDLFFEGPLSGWVGKEISDAMTGVHYLLFNGLLAFIGLHIAAIVMHWLFKRENLLTPMIHGKTVVEAPARAPQPRSGLLALFIFLGVAIGLFLALGR